MQASEFDNSLVDKVSDFLQEYMYSNKLDAMTADMCAEILAENNMLTNSVGPKPGFNFRQLLRDGRDGKINLVKGAYQERPHTEWIINRI